MESHIQSKVEDSLIAGLDFSSPAGATYVLSRTSTSWPPSGGNTYQSPNGVRLMRFTCSDPIQFLDPSQCRLTFTLTNTDATAAGALPMAPLCPPTCWFQRARLLCNGTVIEDIQYNSRLQYMKFCLTPHQRNLQDLIEMPWALETDRPPLMARSIAPNASVRFSMPLPFGLFDQPLFIFLKALPLTIELELADGPTWLAGATIAGDRWSTAWPAVNTGAAPAAVAARNTTNYTISDVMLRTDLVTVDSGIVDQYAQHLLAGRPLSIPFSTHVGVFQVLPGGGNFTVQVMRALSRIKSIFWSFCNSTIPAAPPPHTSNVTLHLSGLALPAAGALQPAYLDADAAATLLAVDTYQWQLQIGGKCWPQQPCRGISETYFRLRQCLDHTEAGWTSILPSQYRTVLFFNGVDLEKAAIGSGGGASFTGVNTRGGESVCLTVSGLPQTAAPNQIFLYIHADIILNATANGCEILE